MPLSYIYLFSYVFVDSSVLARTWVTALPEGRIIEVRFNNIVTDAHSCHQTLIIILEQIVSLAIFFCYHRKSNFLYLSSYSHRQDAPSGQGRRPSYLCLRARRRWLLLCPHSRLSPRQPCPPNDPLLTCNLLIPQLMLNTLRR